ncbi:endocuticle structural protein SgAbd-6-like [Schistocerca cancellata]|uniref:endocuticle structural protein SgAbd-6-like n=1 Tax=Schistocerca cancellata TaxID=274614 RepID=UPI00211911B9|nr:endocuticle structural protein SgAbd-6-like [Schistocerca cancellata]
MSAATLFLVAITLHTVLSAPQQDGSKQATVVEQFNNFNGIDPWRWSYTLSDGSSRVEEGEVVNGELTLSGTYTWKDPEGSVHEMTYIADKQGYRMTPQNRLGTNAGLSLIGR